MEQTPYQDPVIAACKRDMDSSLLRANLHLSPARRLEKLLATIRMMAQFQGVARTKPASLPA
ncbi:MAG: hypothetical protein HS117_16105 [Verrucomicrobiaceae bacterium]|jgi:hypothetical protein|nr:hypothetical protein [Verrucomicrobiaceae bacterium]